MSHPKMRLIIVSNRLPIVLQKEEGKRWKAVPGSGGLVTALAPVLRDRGGLWIGWPGATQASDKQLEKVLARFNRDSGFTLKPVSISPEERDNYYYGFANEVSWPLFHDFSSRCNFYPSYWSAYQKVNRRFAKVIKGHLAENDYIWVHDYHLMNVGRELRHLGVSKNVGFFLHIPFPPLDIYLRLPWRFELLESLLNFDLIGFQTPRDRRNFIQCARALVKDIKVRGKGRVVSLKIADRHVRVGSFPISIDFDEFANLASTEDVADRARYIHDRLPGEQIILGVDRLDYTKGIIERLEAFRTALLRYPELRKRVALVQVVVPSRRQIPEYSRLKAQIERLVGEINGQFTRAGWVPIHYIFRSLERPELVAYYRSAEIALVTPFKDGMNLIAKEFCAASIKQNGVLILSEFAGAAGQLQKGAVLVNPHHTEAVAGAVYQAFKMPHRERRERMRKLRTAIRKQDIYWWVDSFLETAIHRRLNNFSMAEDYVPQFEMV